MSAPNNDNFNNRIHISPANFYLLGNNDSATLEVDEPSFGEKSVWYDWTSPTNGRVSIDTLGSSFDTELGVYTGDSVDDLTIVDQNDDGEIDTTSQLNISVQMGVNYKIAVTGYDASEHGDFILTISFVPNATEVIKRSIAHLSKVSNGDGGAVLDKPYSVFVKNGDYCFVGNYKDSGSGGASLEILNISDAENPVHASKILDGSGGAELNAISGLAVVGNYAYCADYNPFGAAALQAVGNNLEILNISDVNNPVHSGIIHHGSGGANLDGAAHLVVEKNYAYVVAHVGDYLEIINVSNPASPAHAGKVASISGVHTANDPIGIAKKGNYVFITCCITNKLVVVDVSNPAIPTIAASLSDGSGGALLNAPQGIAISGNYAFVSSYTSSAIEIIDISNPLVPTHASSISNGGNVKLNGPVALFIEGNLLYVISQGTPAIEVIDITDPLNPVHSCSLLSGVNGSDINVPFDIFVYSGKIYVSSYGSNVLEIAELTEEILPDPIVVVCGVVGVVTGTINNLDHLEGQEVAILADGEVVPRQVVQGGMINLEESYMKVNVGLPIESDFETINIELQLKDGSIQGKKVKVGNVMFRIIDSRGGWIGPNQNRLYEAFPNAIINKVGGENLALMFSGDIRMPLGAGYEDGGRVFYRQKDPLPITIAAVVPEISIGGSAG